jgi:hypothetical protein
MGLFDWYVPTDELKCPICTVVLREWQGKDGPSALFVWRQGVTSAIAQDPGDASIAEVERAVFRLPSSFEICSNECSHHVIAGGSCDGETWAKTDVVAARPIRATFVSPRD